MPGTAESKNDNAPTSSINLTDIESFSFLFNAIWQTQQNKVPRCQLNLLDTILFHDGTPYRWLFTSSKTGEIMKKKNSRLCYQEVVKSFKARTSILNENKDGNVSPGPVATIWYVESAAVIKASVVDEKELRRLFGSKQALNSVLAIQIYLSRSSLKGSGVFEHRIMVNQDGRRQQQTTEFVNHVDDTQITTFSEGVQRVAVTEAQQNSLKSVSRKLVKAIEDSSRCTVASLVVQVSFDASWTPYIVAARDIILWNAPSDWHGSQPCRNSMIYASGLCPTMCTSSSDLQDGYKHFEEGKSEALKSQVTDSSLTARVISPHDKSAMSTESTNTSAEESADEKILSSFGIEGITQSEGESSSLETSQNLLSSVAQTEDLEEGTILKCDANNSSNSIITKKKLRNRTQSIGEIMIDFFKMMETKDVRTQHLTSDIYPELSDDDSDEDSSRILPIAKVVKKEKLGTCGGQGSASDLDVVAQDSPGSDAEASQAGQDECKTSDISMGKMSPKKLR